MTIIEVTAVVPSPLQLIDGTLTTTIKYKSIVLLLKGGCGRPGTQVANPSEVPLSSSLMWSNERSFTGVTGDTRLVGGAVWFLLTPQWLLVSTFPTTKTNNNGVKITKHHDRSGGNKNLPGPTMSTVLALSMVWSDPLSSMEMLNLTDTSPSFYLRCSKAYRTFSTFTMTKEGGVFSRVREVLS